MTKRSTLIPDDHVPSEGAPTVPAAGGAARIRTTLLNAAATSGLSRDDLAERSGVSRKALYNLFEGTTDPRLSTVEALAHVLGLDLFVAPKALSRLRLDETTPALRPVQSDITRLVQQHVRDAKGQK